MSRISTLFFSCVVLCLLGTNAWADGVEHSAPTPCCDTASFAGAYIGGAVGYGSQRVEVDNLSLGTSFNDRDSSVTFGGYVGYNFQRCCSPFVFGIETDFNYLNTSPTALDIEPPGPGGLPETTSLESNIDWFGTLRGRAGFVVHNNLLLYATGGLAYASVDHTLSDDCVLCGNSLLNYGQFSQSNDKTKVGWTIGGGGELLHDSHWVLRAEALYVDLGSETHSYSVSDPIGVNPFIANAVAKWDDQFWVARLGVAYKFGDSDCCAAPLK